MEESWGGDRSVFWINACYPWFYLKWISTYYLFFSLTSQYFFWQKLQWRTRDISQVCLYVWVWDCHSEIDRNIYIAGERNKHATSLTAIRENRWVLKSIFNRWRLLCMKGVGRVQMWTCAHTDACKETWWVSWGDSERPSKKRFSSLSSHCHQRDSGRPNDCRDLWRMQASIVQLNCLPLFGAASQKLFPLLKVSTEHMQGRPH